MKNESPKCMELLAISIPEAGKLVGLGRSAAYAAARRGEIPTVPIGARFVVPLDVFREQLRARATAKVARDDAGDQ